MMTEWMDYQALQTRTKRKFAFALCPYCGKAMVKTRIELADSWILCWTCTCPDMESVSVSEYEPFPEEETQNDGAHSE